MNLIIRNAAFTDTKAITTIYNHYIKNTIITFEEEEISESDISCRMEKVISNNLPWLVAETNGVVTGYAYANLWKSRSAYRYSVESSIYLSPEKTGCGTGGLLYKELISRIKKTDIHSVIGVIALPNPSSVFLHERLGFKQVATFRDAGIKFGNWIDVGNWQLLI